MEAKQGKHMTIDLIVYNIGQLCIVPAHNGPQRGSRLGELGLVENAALAVHKGRVVESGDSSTLLARFKASSRLDASGRCVVPGFVDPHTHLPWYGNRAQEFEMRLAGASYMEIMASGGGIMSTVNQTRGATLTELVQDNLPRLQRMLAYGTTSAEAKSGYGLEMATELRQLDAILTLNDSQPVDLTPTFLPAHAVPAEYAGRTEAFVDLVVEEMLPAGARWMRQHELTLFCDVFCEEGAFDLDQTRRILEAAAGMGYRLKVHADEFAGLGGTALAVELGAVSADHLVSTPPADILALGRGDTVAVGLPGTPFGLTHADYTPAGQILEAGGALALATDLNPGTTWCESMQMVIALGCRYMGLTQGQALVAATLNAAYAIGRGEEVGSLEPGKQADLLLLSVADYRHLGYQYGVNLVDIVIKEGQLVVDNQ